MVKRSQLQSQVDSLTKFDHIMRVEWVICCKKQHMARFLFVQILFYKKVLQGQTISL